ncbi:DNA sulfur modification protein DndB [Paenibacillus larvae]|uniref:DNA sulfur modification protein DndB n=1 Tax=Paenibacillus larvae TaxID=1464 RepID=UPI002890B922|nr:DNA sulfur modification protein DndB [Paenibacillus larvae]MDT2191903.1 DNA sulfur modification protein DndB [Paenibacillus larvae]MDT2235162.1 DNA sulfur modification protein DndB [Paenibacillus larvae]MDT2257392.1 DNA sulfur modification protein DndB [Paenibacillus larvae]MDT2259840.1 DNA sulfur modification protein DndB [Paenibacillus larvae]MDT2263867.1 DNA sulfur modification protein DndB [Paenibacillus larvae]
MDGLCLRMTIYPFCEKFGLATVAVPVKDLLNYTAIDPVVQRKLSKMQRRKISTYLQERELDEVFFGPVTLSLRDVGSLSKNEEGLVLRHGSKLSVLDGQHRILALGFVNEQMQKKLNGTNENLPDLK